MTPVKTLISLDLINRLSTPVTGQHIFNAGQWRGGQTKIATVALRMGSQSTEKNIVLDTYYKGKKHIWKLHM